MSIDGAEQVLLRVEASEGERGGAAGSPSAADDGEPAPPSKGGGVGCACFRPSPLTALIFLAAAGALAAAAVWLNNAAAVDAQAAAGGWFKQVAGVDAQAAAGGWFNQVGVDAQAVVVGWVNDVADIADMGAQEVNMSSNVTD
ncbi:unnamed protein product [Prorocentrum cordatum]|uniref:Subtilisin n=1 Tax=Prorocentrum cordatum TaxID=2364126 RepID=A0ABN9Q7S0_9DINO|nr:unnamed protein product [Polarella glacialis]